jgi:uncharacterized membrane protein
MYYKNIITILYLINVVLFYIFRKTVNNKGIESGPMETTQRSIAKAISWRIIATIITTALALGLTGRWEFAATIGLADTTVKFFI